MSTDEREEKAGRKRRTLWDADEPKKEAKTGVPIPSILPPILQSQPSSAGLLPTPVSADATSHAMAQVQLQQVFQQQQLLQQVRVMAQQRVAELAAKQPSLPAAVGVGAANRIYVGNLFYELTETELILAFSIFGAILKIDMPKDPATGRHKGFCFIEFASTDAAATALATMNDFVLAGRPIRVGRPNNFSGASSPATAGFPPLLQQQAMVQAVPLQASIAPLGAPTANLVQAKLQAQAVAAAISLQKQQQGLQPPLLETPVANPTSLSSRIYVGSIFYDIKEEDIRAIFGAFGQIKSCQLLPNPETGKHKGFGFVEYDNDASAQAAISSMNGFELAGRQLKVGWASATSSPGAIIPGLPLGTMPGAEAFAAAAAMPQQVGVVKEASISVEKLAASDGTPLAPASTPATAATASGAQEPSPAVAAAAPVASPPSRCIVLLNMVGPEEVDEDLQQEVTEECGKFGVVEKVVIYKEEGPPHKAVDAPVRIFVVFASTPEAQVALNALHGRWFGGRQVLARTYDEEKLKNQDFSV